MSFLDAVGIPSTDTYAVCSRYSTAYAESDYTDRDTDREEGEQEPEQESEEEEDRSCATVLTLRQEEEMEERGLEVEDEEEEEEDDEELQLVTEAPSGELALLLAQSDVLHTGDATLKAEGFRLLLDNRAEVSGRTLTVTDMPKDIPAHSAVVSTDRRKGSQLKSVSKSASEFCMCSMGTTESFCGDWLGPTAICTNPPRTSWRRRRSQSRVMGHTSCFISVHEGRLS